MRPSNLSEEPALLFYLGVQLHASIDKFLFSDFPLKLSGAFIPLHPIFE